MFKFLVIFPILIYIAAIILFVKLCLDVSKIKLKLDKGTDWNDEYRKHRFFNEHDKAIVAAKNYIWYIHNFDYKDIMDRKANYEWLDANIKPYFEEQGIEWPDFKV